jgi:two-component system CheB/CheR fusion protein
MVVFGEHDLSRRAPFPRIDLVLCRNVLIYFSPQLQRRSLQLFAFSLRPQGYLALGKSETVTPLPEYFAVEQPREKVFRRVGAVAQIPPDRIFDSMPVNQVEPRQARTVPARDRTISLPTPQPASPPIQPGRTLETLTTGVALIDRDYHIVSINDSARRLLGIVVAGPGEDVIHRASAVLAASLRHALDGAFRGERTSTQHRIPRDVVDGDGRDLIITCTPAPSSSGTDAIDAVVLEVNDVTSFAQNLRDLGDELDQVKGERDALRERISDAAIEVRELRAASQSMAAELGRLRTDNEQLQLASEEAQAATEELETLNEELQATVEELNTTNADLQARTLELENLAATLERQRAASDIERSRLQVILNSMSEAVLLVDAAGHVVLTNPAWDSQFGLDDELVPEDEMGRALPVELWPQRRVLESEPSTLQFTLPRPDGGRRWFEANTQPIEDDDGSHWGIVVIRDITERSLRQLQQQFLALASHELRTPLTTLSGSLQLLARRLATFQEADRLERHVTRAREQVRRLEQHVAELTDIVHLQSGTFRVERSPIDLVSVMGNALELAQYLANGQTLRGDLPEAPIRADGDPRRLEQVLLNLLVNAFRYAPGTERVDVRLRAEGSTAVIEVQDYGPGVSEAAQAHIFSRFYRGGQDDSDEGGTTSRSGLGLGLFIAREIMTAHGGTIDVDSGEGKGAVFRVRLPLLPDDDAKNAAADSASHHESA